MKKKTISILLPLALAFVFSLFFCAFNTPLGPSIGSDNAIYLTMGTALAQGYAPYTEIFDHKGPMVFLLQMLPQLFSGGYSTLAVFVQEVIFLWLCLLVIDDAAKRLRAPALPMQIAYMALVCSLMGGGNLTEGFSILFSLIGFDTAIAAFKDGFPDEKRVALPAAVMGAMTMIAFMIRANNALPLAAMTLTLAASLLFTRRFAVLLRCAAFFLIGCAACALPVALWLLAHGALGESFYGSIIHNMMYAETGSTSRVHMLLYDRYGRMAMLMACLSCLGALCLLIRARRWTLPVSMVAAAAAAGIAAFISHKFYDHYLMLGAPLAALGLGAILSALYAYRQQIARAIATLALVISVVWIGVKGAETNEWRSSSYESMKTFTSDAKALYALVPQEDRDAFMAYRAEPQWYAASGALPCMRFYFLQEILADADPAVMDEIVNEFHTDPPKWLVIYYNREFGPPYDARVAEIFQTQYEFVDAKGQYQLLRYIDPAQ